MLRRFQYWIAIRFLGWPNVTILLWTAVSSWAVWARDPELFQRAGALCLFSAFWRLTMVVIELEGKKDIGSAVDIDEARKRYSVEPKFKSEGAKELWAETRKANTDFWQVAGENRDSLEETVAERARGALLGGVLGSLQLGFGDLLLNFGLQYIEK